MDRIFYDHDDGVLYDDADGTGAGEQVTLAKLSARLRLTSLDFLIIQPNAPESGNTGAVIASA